jgi:tRNA(Arg) A34 adenosine deaminase TadA
MNRIHKFLEIAAEESEKSNMPMKHGAVIVKGGKIIAIAHNQNRTRLNKKTICSAHAEILALSKVMKSQSCFEPNRQQQEALQEQYSEGL